MALNHSGPIRWSKIVIAESLRRIMANPVYEETPYGWNMGFAALTFSSTDAHA